MDTLRRFEGTSLDELLAYVHRECGESAQIIEANRVRRGGVGGFFAKEGFEVVVAPHGADDQLDDDDDVLGDLGDLDGDTDAHTDAPARPWMRSMTTTPTSQAAAMARALDDADGDELIGDVASAMGGVRTVASGAADREQAITREAIERMRNDPVALVPPQLRTPVAPIKANLPTPGEALLGLVDETNGSDQREPVTFAAALEQAMAEPTPASRTMTLDDLLELELPPTPATTTTTTATATATATEPSDPPAPSITTPTTTPTTTPDAPVTMLAEDFIRLADARYRDGQIPATLDTATLDTAIESVPVPDLVPADLLPADRPVIDAVPVPDLVPADLPTDLAPEPVKAVVTAPASAPSTPALSVVELIARYGQVPTAPALPTGPGVVLVVGDGALAYTTAARLGGDAQVALASTEPPATVPSWSTIRTTDDVLDRVERAQRQGERLILAIELGSGPAGLLWAKRLIDRVDSLQVRMAVSTTAALADVRAAIELLGHIDAVDLSRTDTNPDTNPDMTIDVEQVLCLGTPIATVDGHPTSPALWAALTLEGATNG